MESWVADFERLSPDVSRSPLGNSPDLHAGRMCGERTKVHEVAREHDASTALLRFDFRRGRTAAGPDAVSQSSKVRYLKLVQ